MFWEDQAGVLERVAAGHPLGDVLNDVVHMIERQASGMCCSVLLLSEDRQTVRHAAAPSLPREYSSRLDGLRIGPRAGSCGTAAYLRERVIVEDIASHPYWEEFRHLALPFELRACWSTPIFSAEGEVLGTFAMYYREARGPTDTERGWVDAATHLAAVAIAHDRARTSLQRSEAQARRLARLHGAASAIKEVIVRERDVGRLYEAACRIAVEQAIARGAWIGLVDGTTGEVVSHARAGVDVHLGQETSSDPIARALNQRAPAVFNDIADAPAFPEKATALALGLRSWAIFPMRHGSATTGVLVLHSDQPAAFGAAETGVLSALADDIASAADSARTLAALRQSEERLSAVIEHTPDVAIQWYDEQGRVLFYNEASRRLFQWTETSTLGKPLVSIGFWDASEEARFAAARARARAGGRVAPTEFCFRRADGSRGVLLSTVFEIPLSEVEHCYVCMDVDITEQRNMEAAVRAGEQLRALIYDSVGDVLFCLAVEGGGRYRFQSVNRAFSEATGLAESEVVGRLVDDVIPATSLSLAKEKYTEAISSRRKVVWEEVSHHPKGIRYGEVSVSPIFHADGACSQLVGSVHDMTERREAERAQREIEAQLHQAQRLQALGTLAGGIAHDFNNILAAIHGNLDFTLSAHDVGEETREALVEVKRAAERATSLVRRILTFGRKSEPRHELLELRPVIDEALKLMSVTLKGVKLGSRFASDLPRIRGDSTQIHQVILNLVTNAVQAIGDARGRVDVSLEACVVGAGGRSDAPELTPGRYVRLTIEDDGPGMDEMTLRRAIEPFFTTKPPGVGTGLGLSVVHGIVKSHQGAIAVRSAPRKGTTFDLYFPASDDPPAAVPNRNERTRPRVLFVDDDEAIVFLARRAFAHLGHEVSAHSSSREALEEFRRRPAEFDVVVTDIAMPVLDGPALIRELRGIRPEIAIVCTSGCIRLEDVAAATELGVAQLLDKPQSIDDLARLVQA